MCNVISVMSRKSYKQNNRHCGMVKKSTGSGVSLANHPRFTQVSSIASAGQINKTQKLKQAQNQSRMAGRTK